MFGRSVQMFPRRTFHDAIYEEEYGSDNEDECCRCRGLSAILCWFLSVIILVGLAATVVLTVFFILRSRTLMVKPDADLDVEMYGKDQNMFDSAGGGGTSKELIGSHESPVAVNEGEGGGNSKRKKSNSKSNRRGPPDATKNDVDADVNEEQNAIHDADQEEDASISHHRNHHTHNGRQNRLQPYSPTKTTTTGTTTEAPAEASEEEVPESSSEEEPEQNNEGGSSLFNLFSGPRNPSYSTPNQQDEEEEVEEDDGGAVISAESSAEYKSTRYNDGAPVQQVLFTESPKVTLTTPNPYNNRRNLQTTRFPTGRTSFSTTTTVMPPPPTPQEESEEEEDEEEDHNHEDDEHNNEDNNDEEGDNERPLNHENDETSRENEKDESTKDNEKSSEEDSDKLGMASSSPQTTTSVYDRTALSGESEMGSDSGESQLKQMLLDSIPPHGEHKDDNDHENASNEAAASSEFNLAQKPHTTTTSRPKTQKPTKHRQDTLSRLISRNFTRKGNNANNVEEPETSTNAPSVTTLGPAGHRYDYTMTPVERTKLKIKSGESTEQEVVVSKPTLKSRYRSTTTRPMASSRPPSTTVPRTRGTTLANSAEYGIKLGDKRGSVESPIDIVPSPDLSRKDIQVLPNSLEGIDLSSASAEDHHGKTSSEQQFLDVLVGSEDHKTLVTKKTQDGIVTSAILPPWYDSNGSNSSISDVLATNGTSLSNAVAKVEDEVLVETNSFGGKNTKRKSSEEKHPMNKENDKDQTAAGSEFERLVNMFSKQEQSSEEQTPPPTNRFGFKKQNKPIVLKKPGGALNSRYIPSVPGRANLFSKQESSKQQSSEHKFSPTPSAPSTTASSAPGDVGRAGVLPTAADVEAAVATSNYYPENTGNSDKMVEQHHIESERLSSDEGMDSNEQDASHVIDVNFEEAADSPAEIIIEQDSSAPMEDEEGDFVDDDYEGYAENPQTLSMSASAQNQNFAPVPVDYVRGSGIRKPVSSEESLDAQASASGNHNVTSTIAPSTSAPQFSTSAVPIAIRRPAYTREEILKSSVKPSPESMGGNNHLSEGSEHDVPVGSGEGVGSDEFEEYEDANYEGGSMEQAATGSIEQWSNEKVDHRWSAPDKVRDSEVGVQEPYASEENLNEHEPEETVVHESVHNRLNRVPSRGLDSSRQVNATFNPPPPVSFHENKLSFSAPLQGESQYHSKDGWRPVITETSRNPDPPQEPYYNDDGGSPEANSAQAGSFEPEQEPAPIPQQQQQHQLYQEPLPKQPQQQLYQQPPPKQPQQQIPPIQSIRPRPHQLKPPSIIPPPVSATVKFPDSEEDHEDRHHHGRKRPMHFDRSKYMVRPVPPPIVMRRHPHSTGPFPMNSLNNRQGPPAPPHPQRPQAVPQPPQQNPQFTEHSLPAPPPPPASQPQPRPPISPMNRNFHMRHNPLRRFGFGGPPQAQPRSGGNIKWPTEDSAGADSARDNANGSKRPNIETAQSEVTVTVTVTGEGGGEEG